MSVDLIQLLTGLPTLIEKLEQIGFGDAASSVTHNGQTRPTLARAIKDEFGALQAMVQGRKSFATKADLIAAGAPAADANGHFPLAEVWKDSDENNGIYGWNNGEWVRSTFDSYSTISDDVSAAKNRLTKMAGEIIGSIIKMGFNNQTDVEIPGVATAFMDDKGNSPAYISEDGEFVVALLKALSISVNEDQLQSNPEFNYEMAVVDEGKNVAFGVDRNTGGVVANILNIFGAAKFDNIEFKPLESNYDFCIVDENNNAISGVVDGVFVYEGANGVDVDFLNKMNLLASERIRNEIQVTAAITEFDYNHIVVYGQSLSTGHEGWPALSKTARYGSLMLGDCVRPEGILSDGFTPFGGVSLKPLVANVQSGASILSDQQVAELTPGNGSLGEVVNQGMVNYAKRMHDRLGRNSSLLFVTTNCGVSGKTIEQLSKNNTQDSKNRYKRFTDAVTHVQGIADSENKKHGVTGIVWMQGEWNYSDQGGAENYQSYKASLTQLRNDMISDCMATTEQSEPPVFITYQTGASYTRDIDEFGNAGLHVGHAQWDFAKENNDCFMAGPIYPYTDKGGHLDSNGYRWFGNYLGKIYNKIVTQGQNWKPLSPVKVVTHADTIYISFHVPEPPLVFDQPYVGSSERDFVHKGFKVTDSQGEITIRTVRLVADTVVAISLSRAAGDGARVWYAPKDYYNGNGCLRDSDPAVAIDKYEYLPAEGMYESADIPELNNQPYPLHNWCLAFSLPINWSE